MWQSVIALIRQKSKIFATFPPGEGIGGGVAQCELLSDPRR